MPFRASRNSINIQSPTEFASQQLNADTWCHETLRAVIHASFLFWQEFFDSPYGADYCRYYLPLAVAPEPAGLPHIAIVDPITASTVKTWTGFKDAERLMDKLMELADEPPCDILASISPSAMVTSMPQELSPHRVQSEAAQPAGATDHLAVNQVGALDLPTNDNGVTAGNHGGTGNSGHAATVSDLADSPQPSATPAMHIVASVPESLSTEQVDAIWGPAPAEPTDGLGLMLKIRLPVGSHLIRTFAFEHTFHDVLRAVHASGKMRLDPHKTYKLAMQFGPTVTERAATLKGSGVQRGAYNLSEC